MDKTTPRAHRGTPGASTPEYVAFLRGINVGGHTPVRMEKLKQAFESLRFTNVRTVLASGNVIFQAPSTRVAALEGEIENGLERLLGKKIGVLVRSVDSLQRLAGSQPLKGVDVTPNTRLYVTFLPEKTTATKRIPALSRGGDIRMLRISPCEVISVLALTPGSRTVDLMEVLEKEFGRGITTRNYNTILRVLKACRRPGAAA